MSKERSLHIVRNLFRLIRAALILWLLIATAAFGQQVGADLYRTSTQTAAAPVNAPSPQIGIDNSFLGSVPQGEVTPGVVSLTLLDAIDRGLKFNLGLLLADQGNLAARGARWQALSSLLPNLQAGMAESVQQVNLAAYGLPRAPGTPSVVGPFSVFDTRAVVTQKVVDFHDLYNSRAANENVRAAQFSYQNARDLVVLVVGASYLQALAGSARVGAAEAQFRTAQTIYRQSVDLKNAGMIAGIDVLRAQVEMQAQQQRLLIAQNDFSKQLLALARTIGMPLGQQFTLADRIPNAKAVPITLDEAFKSAYEKRADYGRAQSLLKAAELTRKAAIGGALPSLGVTADYGLIGATPGNSHGTFSTAAALKLPIFQGGKVRGDVMQADALMNRRRAELDDLRGRIEYEVRTAFLDLNAAAQQLEVATSALDVARQQVAQSRDRFAAGVTNNVELVQAQEAQANAEENFIASLYAHNFAKLSLARALGIAEDATRRNF